VTSADTTRDGSRLLPGALDDFAASQTGHALQQVALHLEEGDGRTIVSGRVLTARQARAVAELARAHGADVDLRVAADPDSGLEEGWSEIAVGLLDLWRTPERAGEEMGRQTQYLAADGPLRRLGAIGAWALVQGPDLAMGWAARADLRDLPEGGGASWKDIPRPVEGAAREAQPQGVGAQAVIDGARAELDVPYVWGGTTHAGFDCSGLLQRVVREVAGVLLPRHTRDQRRVGLRVVAGGVAAGDLLFATPRGQKVGHVVLMTSDATVLHACRTQRRVIEESLEDNGRRYQHQGWRRPVLLGG
jgi:cell wall-associated NlpC family hydrolase